MWKISYLFLFTLLLATTAYAAPKKIKADACGIVFHGWVEPETIVHAKASQTQLLLT